MKVLLLGILSVALVQMSVGETKKVRFVSLISNVPPDTLKNLKTFVLDGTIEGRDTGKIVLFYGDANDKIIRDTNILKNGKFTFTGKIIQPMFVWLKAKGEGNTTSFFIEPGRQQVYLEENKYENMTMVGSFTQTQNDTLSEIEKSVRLKYLHWINAQDSLNGLLKSSSDSSEKTKLQTQLSLVGIKIGEKNNESLLATKMFISTHPDSYVSPTYLYTIASRIPTEEVSALYDKFTDKIKGSLFGKLITELVNKRKINSKAPDFNARDIYNNNISLNQYNGKYVLLNFWASWCAPCIKKIPELKEFLKAYNSKGFEIINISIDNKKESWVKAVKKYGIENFHNVLYNKDIEDKYPNIKEPIPSEILVGPTGLMIWNSMNGNTKSLSDVLQGSFSE